MSLIREFFKPGTTVLLAGFDNSVTTSEMLTDYANGSLKIAPSQLAVGTLFGGDIATGGVVFPGIVTADGYDSCRMTPEDDILGIGMYTGHISHVKVRHRHPQDGISLLLLMKCDREQFNQHNRRGRHANPGNDFKRFLNIDQQIRAILKLQLGSLDSYCERLTFNKATAAKL